MRVRTARILSTLENSDIANKPNISAFFLLDSEAQVEVVV